MREQTVAKLIGVAILVFILAIAASSGSYVVEPGFRGVEVTLGKVSPIFKGEGFGWKTPFVTSIIPVTIRQQTRDLTADCYSSDLQQVKTELRVLYRVPEASIVQIYQGYAGDPFDSLIAPRVQEALKEVTAMQSAEQIVKNREDIKTKTLAGVRQKIGTLLIVEDVVIQNIDLSKELETAIEAKMVQEQEAAKAKFTQVKAQIEADTVVIKAKGDAESIKIRGEALKQTPAFIDLQIVEKWDGKAPLYVGGANGGGVNMLLPAVDLKK
jgi:prohibitin 2